MASFFVSYDLNGPSPSHAAMDQHIKNSGWAYGRLLETVWYVGANATLKGVYDYVNSILSANDRVLVIEASNAHFRNLLVSDESIQTAWQKHK